MLTVLTGNQHFAILLFVRKLIFDIALLLLKIIKVAFLLKIVLNLKDKTTSIKY